ARVPLLMRGPGVPAGSRPTQLVNNADITATIVDAARARPGRILDGLSLLPLARDPALASRRPVLLEVAKGRRFRTTAVRTKRWLYAEHRDGSRELYDLLRDPAQIDSRHADPGYTLVRQLLAQRLRDLRDCRGASCRVPVGPGIR
ncbi:MAG: arylsulfatase, partial [Solirubrobacterales bacterium]|nr:arylsulfatase [Solirubrobacterales bacterium]